MIHKVSNHFVISSYELWKPGTYDSERTAKYAFRFKDEDLTNLQNSLEVGEAITFEMLQELRNKINVKENE